MRRWLYTKIFQIVRWYFTGKEIEWVGHVDGWPVCRGVGKVISGRIERENRIPVGLTLFWIPEGLSEIDGIREAPIQNMHYVRDRKKWTYRETV